MYETTAHVGYAVTVGDTVQLIPNISGMYQKWDRQLTQYTEKFYQQSAMAGVVAQYQATDKLKLELSADMGKQMYSKISVAAFDFEQNLDKKPIWQIGGKASYQITDNLAMVAEVIHRQTHYGESGRQNNLSYPSGIANQTSGLLGVSVAY